MDDGVCGVTRGESSGVTSSGVGISPSALSAKDGSPMSADDAAAMGWLCSIPLAAALRFLYPMTAEWNHDTWRIKARDRVTTGTSDDWVMSRDEGRRQSRRKQKWKAIRMRKNETKNRRSFRNLGKRFEMARSKVGAWALLSAMESTTQRSSAYLHDSTNEEDWGLSAIKQMDHKADVATNRVISMSACIKPTSKVDNVTITHV